MTKITDMIISAVLKKGVLYEGRNVDITVDIPNTNVSHPTFKAEDGRQYYPSRTTSINIKAEHMTISLSNKNE